MDAPYQRLAAALRDRIESGEWPPGCYFPSTQDLVAEYHLGRGTVQLAIGALRREGLLEGRPGARLTVAYAAAMRTLTDADLDLVTLLPSGDRPPFRLGDVERGTMRPTPELKARLRVGERARLHRVRAEVLDPDGRPAMLLTTWQRGCTPRGYVGTVCELRPHHLSASEAKTLGLAVGASALLVERSRLDGSGSPVQTADLVLPADRWRVCLRSEPTGQ